MTPFPTPADAGAQGSELLGLPPDELRRALERFLEERDEPAYRLEQLENWIYDRLAASFGEMTTLPRGLRDELDRRFSLAPLEPDSPARSADGAVIHLREARDGAEAESVLLPAPERLTLRISTRAGRGAARRRPAPSGRPGLGRRLAAAEIVAQFRSAARFAREEWDRHVTHVVYAAAGEPLAATGALFPSLRALREGYGLDARRITVATAGNAAGTRALARLPEPPDLLLVLPLPDPAARGEAAPSEAPPPPPEAMDALREYVERSGRRVRIEYALAEGLDDGRDEAEGLADLLTGLDCIVELIPWTPDPGRGSTPGPAGRARAFARTLHRRGVSAVVRKGRRRGAR